MIDVFILIMHNERQDWFQQCLDSLKDQPVNVRIIDGIPGNTGRGRVIGLALGDEPYVAYVDPDDIIPSGAFAACEKALDENPDAAMAYTREARIDENGTKISEKSSDVYKRFLGKPYEPYCTHHLSVYRRSALPEDLSFMENFGRRSEWSLKEKIWQPFGFVFVDVLGYYWRKHDTNYSNETIRYDQYQTAFSNRKEEALRLSLP